MRVMIVDDEPLARQRLQRLLGELDGVEVVAEAEHGEQALQVYRQARPELLLLDIEMPGMDGLSVAAALAAEEPAPAVVFCTAYDEHAIAAFEARAVAYLLKPVNRERLAAALQAASRPNQAQLGALASHRGEPPPVQLCARSGSDLRSLPVAEVRYFLADQKYVSALHPGGELVLDKSLKELEHELGQQVQRVHRNALVCWQHVRGLQPLAGGRYRVLLAGMSEGPQVSRRHLSAFRARLTRQ